MAAENLRLKSEKRRSDMALKVQKKKSEPDSMHLDELGKISQFFDCLIPDKILSSLIFVSFSRLENSETKYRKETKLRNRG